MLKSNNETDRKFQSILNELIPKANEFYTLSGHPAFANDYKMVVPFNLVNFKNAALVGTAFDYLARLMIARIVKSNQKEFLNNLKATDGYEVMERFYKEDALIPLDKLQIVYEKGMSLFELYIAGEEDINKMIPVACFFAKLENVYRSGRKLANEEKKRFFSKQPEDVIRELADMCSVFQDKFLIPKVISSESEVIYNPNCGVASLMVNGADADIIIDGVLYDFKTTKKSGYAWDEVAQLIGYYCLNNISSRFAEIGMPFPYKDLNIKKVAFYKARYGEVEYYDISQVEREKVEKITEDLIWHFKDNPSLKMKMNIDFFWNFEDYSMYI